MRTRGLAAFFLAFSAIAVAIVPTGRASALDIIHTGYRVVDSNEPGGPVLDPTFMGAAMLTNSDDGTQLVTPGFSWLFFGREYDQVLVHVNGAITFGSPVGATNRPLGTNQVPGMFPFWDDLDTRDDVLSGLRWTVLGTAPSRTFVVQWNSVERFPAWSSAGDHVTFQTHIHETSSVIEFHYVDVTMDDPEHTLGGSATIGIDPGLEGGPFQSFQLGYNQPVLSDGYVIRFQPFICDGKMATIVGSEGDDVILATRFDDVVVARGGNDSVVTYGGNDTICVGGGDDSVNAGGENDRIFGGDGGDRLLGGPGDDHVEGNLGDDDLAGGSGDDMLLGGFGVDTVRGSGGDDVLKGGGDDDALLSGGAGADIIEGGPGNDNVQGNKGHDDRLDGGGGDDLLNGGVGRDSLDGNGGHDLCNGGDDGHLDIAARCERLVNIP